MPSMDFVRSDTAKIVAVYTDPKTNETKTYNSELLWGDPVQVIGNGRDASEVRLRARGMEGFVAKSDLGGDPLLEVYFIDVGQGDGILIVTPDRRHVLIDGGWPRAYQPTGRNAADFVDWKFAKDYRRQEIELDTVLCSHNDQDHYGGLWDLLNPNESDELDIATKDVSVEQFFHAGLSWWTIDGKRSLGNPVDSVEGKMFTQLIDSRNSVINGLKVDAKLKLQGEWADFLRCVTKTKTKAGSATPMKRLGHVDNFVPGYEAGSSDVSIRVLAPVEFEVGGKSAIRYFSGGPSKNTNGNSLLLRLDYGRTRILMTGDLNTASMQSLLADWTGQRQEFQCDVAKACHHGSDDVSYEFLSALQPAVTVISSGDAEGHDHPRPAVVAASATTGYFQLDNDKLLSPLIYSTELARSVKLGKPKELRVPKESGGGSRSITGGALKECVAVVEVTDAGQRKPTTKERPIGGGYIVAGTIYGLVNVRTDGHKILCATLNEASKKWEVRTLRSRF